MELAAVIHDPVTTTDELIPSGETSSYRSNPLRLAEFTLSRRVPEYVGRAKADRGAGEGPARAAWCRRHLREVLSTGGRRRRAGEMHAVRLLPCSPTSPATAPPGSRPPPARRCWGALPTSATSFATKRYRSNCINWGILPFTLDEGTPFDYESGDCVFVPHIRQAVESGQEDIPAKVICKDGSVHDLLLHVKGLTADEKEIILDGCLMNYYAKRMAAENNRSCHSSRAPRLG